ncbi:MAG: CRTAC1 family protein [Planctomycetota bacterium]
MARPLLPTSSIRVVFVGLLALTVWLDRLPNRSIASVAGGTERFGFQLTEVSHELGIDFVHQPARFDPVIANVEPHIAAMGASVAVCDPNGDGWPDLYATSSAFGTSNALYLNLGVLPDGRPAGFSEAAGPAGLAELNRAGEGASMGSTWADFDNDGDEDVYVYKYGYGQLLRNDGELRFTDVTAAAGLRRWMNCNSAIWFDYDRDGQLDLYAAGYFQDEVDLWNLKSTRIMHESFEFARNGGHNLLWRNVGAGRFEDVTARTGCDSTRWTLAVAAADFDGDGWQDLYLANDYGPEELFLNEAGRGFVLARVGLGEDSKSGMSVAVGDTRNSGRLDVFVTNISKSGFIYQGNNLRLNLLDQGGVFHNDAYGVVADCGWAWGAQFGDLNNDGWQDLIVLNGFISADRARDYWHDMSKVGMAAGDVFQDAKNWAAIGTRSLSGYERSRLLLNQGRGRFLDVAEAQGLDDDLLDGRGVALADLWRRGALDVIVANQKGPLQVYRNDVATERAWIAFDLVGSASNRGAIGAQITVSWTEPAATEGGAPVSQQQSRVVESGSGFCSQNDRQLHFGLGTAQAVERAVIRWPSGREQTVAAPALRTRHRLEEPR